MKPQPELLENVPLAPLTTIGLGGPARFFARVRSSAGLVRALRWAAERDLPVQVLGGGSNTVFADEGFAGLVLHIVSRGIAFRPDGEAVLCVAQAGSVWDDVVAAAVAQGLGGIECLSGIPGSVGATPVQNVGAYGQEIAESLKWVRAYERPSGRIVRLRGEECGLGYRQSRFKGPDRDRFVILAVAMRLRPGERPHLGYREVAARALQDGVAGLPPAEALAAVRRIVLDLRRGKSMLRDLSDPNARSVGSFFLNPVLTKAQYAGLKERLGTKAAELPVFPSGESVKVSAAWLIGAAGFMRGERRDGVGISERHLLALVNRGGNTRQLLALSDEIRRAVARAFAIELQPEPVIVPFDPQTREA